MSQLFSASQRPASGQRLSLWSSWRRVYTSSHEKARRLSNMDRAGADAGGQAEGQCALATQGVHSGECGAWRCLSKNKPCGALRTSWTTSGWHCRRCVRLQAGGGILHGHPDQSRGNRCTSAAGGAPMCGQAEATRAAREAAGVGVARSVRSCRSLLASDVIQKNRCHWNDRDVSRQSAA
jgi:hypothetical protein